MGVWEGGQSKWCRDDGNSSSHRHFHTPGSTHICTLPHRSHAPPCTPLYSHMCGPHTYSLLQPHTSAHTHHMRSQMQSSSTPMCRGASADAQGYTHLQVHTSPHTGAVTHTCAHTRFPPHTGKWICASETDSRAVHNSTQVPLSP